MRYGIVPQGTGASKMPSRFTDDYEIAIGVYREMLANGANSVMMFDYVDNIFVFDYAANYGVEG